jgi:iron complex outermembrane receptor protein
MIRQLLSFGVLVVLGSVWVTAPAGAQSPPSNTTQTASAANNSDKLEEVVITAQKRVDTVQNAPLAITAITGADIQDRRLTSAEDISHSIVGLSWTATSPQAWELNIRGVTNTRLTSATADQSVSTFIDDVYVSRSGTMNAAFYDVERVEIERGPQGVLLGKNVSGGALSVISNEPKFEPGADIDVDVGNYNLHQTQGFITGPLIGDNLAGRISFQTIDHGGYAYDLLHNVPLENLDSIQARAQLLYKSSDSDFRAKLIVDYDDDKSNGINRAAVPAQYYDSAPGLDSCQPEPCFQPWSTARTLIGQILGAPLSPRVSYASWPTFAGNTTPTPQQLLHENESVILKIEKGVLPDVTLTSVTGYRGGHANTFYDQGGVGPDNPYYSQIVAEDPVLFEEPVYFQEWVSQVDEELRLTSHYAPDNPIDWIAGVYLQHLNVHHFDRFWGDSLVLPTLCGQSNWNDFGTTRDYAAFAQIGYKITQELKFDLGVRYTQDRKEGTQSGLAASTNCPTQPDKTALEIAAGQPVSVLTPLGVPEFVAPYGQTWSKVTPQGTLTFKPDNDLMSYLTVSSGYKGGGFEGDCATATCAQTAYQPETVTNYELGVKWTFLNGKARWNTAIFDMNYHNLQVEQTIGNCLCNEVQNAGSAIIRGIETEFQWQVIHQFYFYLSGSYLHDRYVTFDDLNNTYNNFNSAGNQLQRTPDYQLAAGIETNTSVGNWADALRLRLSFKEQGKMYWTADNYTWENAYGILDGRLSLNPPGQNWNVSIWGKNIGNTLYRTSIIAIFGDEISSYGAPRTFGASFNLHM